MSNDLERFERYIDKAGVCWQWRGAFWRRTGYGMFTYQCKTESAHRASYLLHVGKIPAGMFVLHRCDNRLCVNPEHLWLGTQQDNMRDRSEKGRRAQGVANGQSKLDEAAVREIRSSKKTKELADKYGVHRTLIQQIRRGKGWSHIR